MGWAVLAFLCALGCSGLLGTLSGDGRVAWVQEGWENNIAAALSDKLRALVGGGT
jgi:hypothetical protein